MNIIDKFSKIIGLIYRLNTFKRRIILNFLDIFIIFLSFNLVNSFFSSFSNKEIIYISRSEIFYLISYILISLFIYNFSGLYKSILRYFKSSFIYFHFFRSLIILFLNQFFIKINSFESPSDQFIIIFFILNTSLTIAYRFVIRDLVLYTRKLNKNIKNIVIFGVGINAVQLAQSLLLNSKYRLKNFIVDNPKLWGRKLLGFPISSPRFLEGKNNQIDKIFVIVDDDYKKNKSNILRSLQKYSIPILKFAPIESIEDGNYREDNLQTIDIEDLLGREVVNPDLDILDKSVEKSNVCIVGAGGSIGAEICSQLMEIKPLKIILIDSCEFNLYKVEIDLINKFKINIDIVTILGCAKDQLFLENVFTKNQVDIVFHAAAYKHVPMVERNPISGISNNMISTYSLCKAAKNCGVKKFVLISSDKAVRPKNIMGATKRLSELIVQSFSEQEKEKKPSSERIIFSMVRFGNVLNSSGSVIPLFKKQIINGGPVTITHKDVKRYFMTIKEAAQLVIQTLLLSNGGEIFILDMGDQIKISKLAKQMILLNGKTIKDKNNINGEIEIRYTGLREGEKMFEELLIDSSAEKTSHPLIFKAVENSLKFNYLDDKLKTLEEYLLKRDSEKVLNLLKELVPEWERS